MEENKQVIEERTLEEVLLELRESKNYTYLDITEKLNQKGTYIEEKIIKKWDGRGHWPVSGPRDRNTAGRLYQSGFGAGQGFGIFHYVAD